MDRGPFDYPIVHYIGFWTIGALGHLVARLQYVTDGATGPITCWFCVVIRLLVVIMTGGLVGVLTFWAGEGLHAPMHFTAAAAGIMGHMGVKAFEIGESLLMLLIEKIKRSIDPTGYQPPTDDHDPKDEP